MKINGLQRWRIALLPASIILALSAPPAGAGHMEGMAPQEKRVSPPTALKKVAPDLYFLYDDRSSNAAFLVTEEGVLVVDTRQHPRHGQDLIERTRKITDKPIRWAVVTHFHGDHYMGSPALKQAGAMIVSHRDTAAMIKKYHEQEIARRQAFFKTNGFDPKEVKLVIPDATFEQKMTINLGGRIVELLYMGPGQNPGDTLVYFPHLKTLFTGGPFSRKNWPNTAFTPSVGGWVAMLKKIAAMDIDQYLPGHGDVGSKQDLLDEAKLLGDLEAEIKAAFVKGMSREEMVKNLYFREYKELRNYDRLHGFIESMYNLVATGKSAFQLP